MIFKRTCETCIHSMDNNSTGEICDRCECMIPELPYYEPIGGDSTFKFCSNCRYAPIEFCFDKIGPCPSVNNIYGRAGSKIESCPVKDEAVKHDQGKPRMSLVPPNALEQVAKAMSDGAVKYSDDNYLKGGFSHRRLIDAALRHINAHLQGFDMDISGNTHLSHAAASILMLMEAIKLGKITDDRYKE